MSNETIENAESVNIGGDPTLGLIERAEMRPHLIDPDKAFGYNGQQPAILVLPSNSGGMERIDMLDAAKAREAWKEQLAAHPLARRGTAVLTHLLSFVAWVLRFKRPETVIFASSKELCAMIDYHGPEAPGGRPGHLRHRGIYAFPFSRAWQIWSKIGEKPLGQKALAEFIEDRIQDIADPKGDEIEKTLLGVTIAGPSTMLQLARGIEVRAKLIVKDAITLASGEARVSFDEEHTTANKEGSAITVPGAFMVAIPIYEGGALWRLAVRLRYRLVEGRVMWSLALAHADAALEESFDEVLRDVAKETGVLVLRGAPEHG